MEGVVCGMGVKERVGESGCVVERMKGESVGVGEEGKGKRRVGLGLA